MGEDLGQPWSSVIQAGPAGWQQLVAPGQSTKDTCRKSSMRSVSKPGTSHAGSSSLLLPYALYDFGLWVHMRQAARAAARCTFMTRSSSQNDEADSVGGTFAGAVYKSHAHTRTPWVGTAVDLCIGIAQFDGDVALQLILEPDGLHA